LSIKPLLPKPKGMTGKQDGRAGPSLAGRLAAAIALTVGFYLLAVAIAAALIGLPLYGLIAAGRGNIWLTLFGLVTGASILMAIVPRRMTFTPPGPRISPSQHPRLMAAVADVARDTGQAMPTETYVTLEVNAAVTEISNGLFRHRRRVLIVGLPLLHILSERGFRGVLAHEFGHYAGGDTRLGPWIWRTRETITRTIARLTDDEDDSWSQRAVRLPFIWYGNAFLRITNAISRREEFAADALAARAIGRDAHVEALRHIHALAPGFDAYWEDEVVPFLSSGHRPPLLAGFASFAATERVRLAAATHLEHVLARTRAGAYESHPALAERIAAAADFPPGPPDDSPPAAGLIEDADALELAALARMGGGQTAAQLAPARWEDAAELVWLPACRELVAGHRDRLQGATVADIGALAADPHGAPGQPLSAALALALDRAGWQAVALPGDPVSLARGNERIVPVGVIAALASGEMAPDTWRERAGALGVGDAPLVAPDPEPAIT
jgi:heat shock protein HtpX